MSENVLAEPTTPQQAQEVVQGWLSASNRHLSSHLGNTIDHVSEYRDASGQATYHVIHLQPSGFVVVPADDQVEPIIGFSSKGTYDPSIESPLTALVTRDLPGRLKVVRQQMALPSRAGASVPQTKWRVLRQAGASYGAIASLGTVSDVRVGPLVQSQWDQYTESGSLCYNYYTPNNYPCGCVATAMAQLMRFYQFPTAGIGTVGFGITVNGASQKAYTRGGNGSGGPYNWGQMTLVPSAGVTTAGCQAIGALCYDAGIAVNMDYSRTSSGAYNLGERALVTTFGYGNAIQGYNAGLSLSQSAVYAMVNPNLDAGYPVLLGIYGAAGGHAVVADGYGFNTSTMYHHLNMGWDGQEDAWYNLPNINSSPSFSTIFECGYNIFASGSGEIISGRVLDSAGNPVAGAALTATAGGGTACSATTSSAGVYAFAKIAANMTYTVHVSAAGHTFADKTVTTGQSRTGSVSCGNLWAVDFAEQTLTGPQNPHPTDGQSAVPVSAVLSWNGGQSSSCVTYDVYLDTANPPVLQVATGQSTTTFTPVSLANDTIYYWQVVAGSGSASLPGPVWSFHTVAAGQPGDAPQISLSASAVDFGQINAGLTTTRTLTVSNTGTAVLTVSSAALSDTVNFGVTGAPVQVAPGTSSNLTLSFRPAQAGAYSATLTIQSDDPTNPAMAVSLSGLAVSSPNVSVSTNSIDFGQIPAGRSVAQSLTISNTGTSALTITGYQLSDTANFGLSGSKIRLAPGAGIRLSVIFRPTQPGSYTGTLTILSSDPAAPQVTVSLKGQAIATPRIRVSKGNVIFGQTAVGSTTSQTLTIYNTGTAPLNISNVQLSDTTDFGVTGSVTQVAAGASAQLTLVFHPAKTGMYTTTLKIQSDDPDNRQVTIWLTGQAGTKKYPPSPRRGW